MNEETEKNAKEKSSNQSGSSIDKLPRVFSIIIIVGFFLPWVTLSGELKIALEVFAGSSNISAFDYALGLRDYHVILLLIPFAALNAFSRHTKEGYLFSSLLILSIGFIFGPTTIFAIKGGIAGELIKQSYGLHLFLSASLGMLIYGIIACRNNPNFYRHAVGAILCSTILAGSGKVAKHFVDNQEETEKRTPPPNIPLVEAETLQLTSFTIHLPSQGRVQARAVTSINPEVSGRIISIEPSFKEGGFFKPGQKLLTLDNSDYLNAIAKTKGAIAQLKAKLALEKIERSSLTNAVVIAESNLKQAEASLILKIAERDAAIANLKRINKLDGASSLAKKEPQVAEAQANVEAKQATLIKAKTDLLEKPKQMEAELLGQIQVAESEAKQAQRNLERTTVYAPRYQGRITEKRVDVGQVVNANTILATAIAIDYAEVRLPVSNQSLAHLNVPEQLVRTNQTQSVTPSEPAKLPAVTLSATIGAKEEKWMGHIDRAESRYDSISQQLFLIAQVPEPYDRKHALRAGLFVRADIIGNTMENVFVLDRHTVRRGNEVVLAIKKEGPIKPKGGTHLLKRKPIKILWRDEEKIITQDLEPGDILITSSIEYAADDDELRVIVDGKPPLSPKGKGNKNQKPSKASGQGPPGGRLQDKPEP